jgi:UDP-N-acetylmuramate dehydrogenase
VGSGDPDAVAVALETLEPLGDRAVARGELGALTTYRVGGAAAILVTAGSLDDLYAVATAADESGLPVLVVGRGSNLLVADAGFPGIAVVLDPAGFADVTIERPTVAAGAAVALPALARQTVEAGLTGMEWAVGVPGSVGGAVRMNAGGHGSDVAHTLVDCHLVDLGRPGARVEVRTRDQLRFGYRSSAVTASMVVTGGRFALQPGDPDSGRDTIRQIVRWRREHQPGGQNAGSVFTNPPGDSAGRIIDAAGLKGRRFGSAMVSPKHANFIQADTGGRADDVKALMAIVAEEVLAKYGITLHPEVRMVGFGPNPKPQVKTDPFAES